MNCITLNLEYFPQYKNLSVVDVSGRIEDRNQQKKLREKIVKPTISEIPQQILY